MDNAVIKYAEHDLVLIGARHNNKKRNYLLINPLQGKHIPTQPTKCIDMITSLGNKLKEKYPNTKLVIGFAETATAIAAGVASVFKDCNFICTTRESYPNEDKIEFLEEHSHATEQILLTKNLKHYIDATDTIILVDDELSTGKTMLNIMDQLKKNYPELNRKTIIAASIINRMTDENINILKRNGIICEPLLKIRNIDYTEQVSSMLPQIKPANTVSDAKNQAALFGDITLPVKAADPRKGMAINGYDAVSEWIDKLVTASNILSTDSPISVIGTEECMYPAILYGTILEKKGYSVTTHSTTRSPIGAMNTAQYPIKNGYVLPSFYNDNRTTYIYNMDQIRNGTAIIITDSNNISDIAMQKMKDLLVTHGFSKIILVKIKTWQEART